MFRSHIVRERGTGTEHSASNQKVGMKCPRFEGGMKKYDEWKEFILDWMETGGKHLEYPCLSIRQSLRVWALEVGRRMER